MSSPAFGNGHSRAHLLKFKSVYWRLVKDRTISRLDTHVQAFKAALSMEKIETCNQFYKTLYDRTLRRLYHNGCKFA